ncbi:mannose-1-phosphate guanylyltransferase [soil metagenome]
MIMAGGAGTRLWPMSRMGQPKQLLPLIQSAGDDGAKGAAKSTGGPRSLLQVAADRLSGLVPPERRYICTGEAYRAPIRASLPEFGEAQILGEPAARDTLNAVGFTAAVLHKLDPEAVFAVFTADHVITPPEVFRARVEAGFRLVEADPRRLVTFSIKPTYAATGFGYIERGGPITGVKGAEGVSWRVARYVEKPSIERAQAYVQSGHFGWSSGMFVWKAATVLEAIQKFKPAAHEGLMKIRAAWGTKDQQQVLEAVYPTLPKISVDYALMEPASTSTEFPVCTVLMDLSWLDVGSWPSYGQTLEADGAGNRLGGVLDAAHAVLVSSKDNLVVSSEPGHTVALLGCEEMIVVHTAEATLVMPRARAEELKVLHGLVDGKLK